LVSNRFQSHSIPLPAKFDAVEIVAFCLITASGNYRFIVVYRPPEFNKLGRDNMRLLKDCLMFLCNTKDTVFIIGDFNLPCINWESSDSPDDQLHSVFLEFCLKSGFNQFVTEPTLGDHVLDLVLSNDKLIVSDLKVTCPFSNGDHCMVYFNLLLNSNSNEPFSDNSHIYYDFSKGDYGAINDALYNHPFNNTIVQANSIDNVCFSDSADDVWKKFVEPLNIAFESFIPVKSTITRGNTPSKQIKYHPPHIRRAIKLKSACWKAYRLSPIDTNLNTYKRQAAIVKKLLFDYEKQKELELINRNNLGGFYRFLNNKLSCKSGVGPLRIQSGSLVTEDSTKAEVLNDYFCSVFTKDDGVLPIFPKRVTTNVSIGTIDFSPQAVLKALKSIKRVSNACDPDGYTTNAVKKLMYSLVSPLCVLFKFIFSYGKIPAAWKTANVVPIFKKGLSSSVSNYRPISLTSIFCKLYERIIKDQMLFYLSQHKLINRNQHGFLSRHGTCTQLLETINDWSIALRNHHAVDTVYFDFAKAFDSVSHTKLLYKLTAYGIDGDLFSCITDFLHHRIQRVVLPNGTSSFKSVLSGVPQGSVLGPLLFLLYINDISDLFTGDIKIKMFADDIC